MRRSGSTCPRGIGAERDLEIADHLLAAEGCPLSGGERARAIELDRRAGTRSLACGAGASAASYLEAAARQFRDADWEHSPDQGWLVFTGWVEALVVAGQLPEALDLLERIAPRARFAGEEVQIVSRRVRIPGRMGQGDPLGIALRSASGLGFRSARRPGRWRVTLDLWRTDRLLQPALLGAPPARGSSGREWLAPVFVLEAAGCALLWEHGGLAARAAAFVLRTASGPTAETPNRPNSGAAGETPARATSGADSGWISC